LPKTDEGLSYRVLRSPDEAPPVVLAVTAPAGQHWTERGAHRMVGQAFGMKWRGRVLPMRVVGARVNPMTHELELSCR
jgi:hypothetical protein